MGVDTKGFTLTDCKDVLRIGALIERTLNHLIIAEKRLRYPDRKDFVRKEAREQFRTCTLELLPTSGAVRYDFVFDGEQRTLTLNFTCDCDHVDYGPQSVSMSLGCWGRSGLFIKSALHALTLVGDSWYDENDGDNISYAPLDERKVTVLAAVQLGYLSAYAVSEWVRDFDKGLVGTGSRFDAYFGADEAELRACVALEDYKECVSAIEALANRRVEMPGFLADFHEESLALAAA